MRAVIQRVSHAAVTVDGTIVGQCGTGLFILLGVGAGDTESEAALLIEKIAKLRIFCDEAGKMNRSVTDIGGSVLLVSQFTLYANCRHGNRPDFLAAEKPGPAEALYLHAAELLRQHGISTACGVFGADMKIDTALDGPVTICLDTEQR